MQQATVCLKQLTSFHKSFNEGRNWMIVFYAFLLQMFFLTRKRRQIGVQNFGNTCLVSQVWQVYYQHCLHTLLSTAGITTNGSSEGTTPLQPSKSKSNSVPEKNAYMPSRCSFLFKILDMFFTSMYPKVMLQNTTINEASP